MIAHAYTFKNSKSMEAADSDACIPQAKKREVTVNTVERWKVDNDKAMNSSMWLTYDKMTTNHECVDSLKCLWCIKYKDRLIGCRNYNAAFVVGSKNLGVSAVKEHSLSEMHKRAMMLFNKSQGRQITEYSPIAKALSFLDESTACQLKKKFDIAYFICKERMPLENMKPLCELQERAGVDMGTGYKNNQACATFVEYIAQEQRELVKSVLEKCRFYSVQCDGSTDSANVEEELFLVMYCDPHAQDGRVHLQQTSCS